MRSNPIEQRIQSKLTSTFAPVFLEVLNESHRHSVPEHSETHFKVTLVSSVFESVRAVARHQKVYQTLADELAGGVHALALHTFTESEWREKQADNEFSTDSPDCRGGSLADPLS